MSAAGTPSTDPWVIVARERARYEEQFRGLSPANGMVTGNQAKGFLLRSELPPPVLGQIWSLADTDADGKMDINEFSIACKLINLRLRGMEVPTSLPPSLLASLRVQSMPAVPQPVVAHAQLPPTIPPLPNMMPQQIGVVPPLVHQYATPVQAYAPPIPPLPANMLTQQTQVTQIPDTIGIVSPVTRNTAPPTSNTPRASVTSLERAPMPLESPQADWALPHHIKLKYTQIFNTTDRTRSGYLSGPQARNVMVQTKLPQNILAQVWSLSDMDNDGRLGCEEFVLAMYLCEQASLGTAPPVVLPVDLIPPSFRRPGFRPSLTGGGTVAAVAAMHGSRSGSRSASISSQGSGVPPPVAAAAAAGGQQVPGDNQQVDLTLIQQNSFEDKRKENYEKGQAELERRRKALLEAQRKEAEERERKEREEADRRERARMEGERRRAEEMERQLREQQERERLLDEERRREVEQRETARREMERQRQLEWEKQRLQELQQQRQREQEAVLKLKAKNQSLTIELSSLNDRVKEVSQKICDTRVGVSNVKGTIDGMRTTRDTQMQEMALMKNKLKEQNARLLQMSQEKARMDARNKANVGGQSASEVQQQRLVFEHKEITIKNLQGKIGEMERQIDGKMSDIENNDTLLGDLRERLKQLLDDCEILYVEYGERKEKIMEMKGASRAMDYGGSAWKDNWGATDTTAATTVADGGDTWPEDKWATDGAAAAEDISPTTTNANDLPGIIKYRALYDFVQRNKDEISFQSGDIINVSKEQTGDPGWLAGEIRGGTGWFPESYVEPLDGIGVVKGDNTVIMSNNTENTKLEGIEEVVEADTTIADELPAPTSIPATDAIITHDTNATPATSDDIEEYYIASYPYQSVERGDLNFNAGYLITVIKKDGDWWTGRLDDNTVGIFPSNYVQKTDITTDNARSGNAANATETIKNNGNRIETPPPVAPPVADNSTAGLIGKADLDADMDNEICAINEANEKPDYSSVTNQIASNQATPKPGAKKPEIASVIAAYEATSKEQLSLARGQLIMIRKKTDSGWWEGELQAKGRKRQVGWFPASYVKVMNSSGRISGRSTPVSTTRIQQEVVIDKVMALYPYTAANTDELSFLKDDIISVTSRDEQAWWRGELNGVSGLFPSNYVSPLQQSTQLDDDDDIYCNIEETESPSINQLINVNKCQDRMRQESINELISTERGYIDDMSIVHQVFEVPLRQSRVITDYEVSAIFVNWQEILRCNKRFLEDLIRRVDKSRDNIIVVGDIILNHLPNMTAYVTFCSRQLESATLLQHLTETSVAFRDLVRRCQNNVQTKGMPLSSFLIKPMQRITKYPLLINKILENTPQNHSDYPFLQKAIKVADDFLKSVNENVRLKENQDRLKWMQTYIIQPELNVVFNSCTNKLGQRKLIHYGILTKVKSGKELIGFLLNDFLLLVQTSKALMFSQFAFQQYNNVAYKVYKQPILIQDLTVSKASADLLENDTDANRVLKMVDKKQIVSLLAPTVTECNSWIKQIDSTKEAFHKIVKRQKFRARTSNITGANVGGAACGRLLVLVHKGKRFIKAVFNTTDSWMTVAILHAKEIYPKVSKAKRNKSLRHKGKIYTDNVYCKVSVGDQEQDTDVAKENLLNSNGLSGTNNNGHAGVPTAPSLIWNQSMQFHVRNMSSDVMTLLVYKLCPYRPDEFLGMAEVKIRDVYMESQNTNGPIMKKLILHQVESGEVTIKLDFQRFTN